MSFCSTRPAYCVTLSVRPFSFRFRRLNVLDDDEETQKPAFTKEVRNFTASIVRDRRGVCCTARDGHVIGLMFFWVLRKEIANILYKVSLVTCERANRTSVACGVRRAASVSTSIQISSAFDRRRTSTATGAGSLASSVSRRACKNRRKCSLSLLLRVENPQELVRRYLPVLTLSTSNIESKAHVTARDSRLPLVCVVYVATPSSPGSHLQLPPPRRHRLRRHRASPPNSRLQSRAPHSSTFRIRALQGKLVNSFGTFLCDMAPIGLSPLTCHRFRALSRRSHPLFLPISNSSRISSNLAYVLVFVFCSTFSRAGETLHSHDVLIMCSSSPIRRSTSVRK